MTHTGEQLDIWADAVAECLAWDEVCEKWEITKIALDEVDTEGAHFVATDGGRFVGVLVRPDGRAEVEDRYTHRVGRAEQPADDDRMYTSLAVAQAEAEALSNGSDHVYAVWDITDLYPQIVAFAYHLNIYTKR